MINQKAIAGKLQGKKSLVILQKIHGSYVFSVGSFFMGMSALHQNGWFKSARKKQSIDKAGNPIPWITYAAIDFLSKRVNKKLTVFEFGCGNSTLWWARRVNKVTSCEHDKEWYKKMKEKLPKNAKLIFRALDLNGEYSSAAAYSGKKFDVIVVDGRDRVNCALNSLTALTKHGVIVWDNTYRERYFDGLKELELRGFKRIDFYGMSPIDNVNSLTSVFYKRNNCLGI